MTLPVSGLEPPDRDCVGLALCGNPVGIEVLYTRYAPALVRYATRFLKDPAEAEDVAQVAFSKLMNERNLRKLHGSQACNVKAWLYRTTRNYSLNQIRDRKRRENLLDGHHKNLPEAHHSLPGQEGPISREELRAHLDIALSGLTADHREIIEARFYEELTYRGVAEILELKLGTVMSRLSRAKDALREILKTEEPYLRESLETFL